MRILSLDISTKSTGWCVLDSTGTVKNFGTWQADEKDFLERARTMSSRVEELIYLVRPDHVVIEELKVIRNQRTLTMLAITQGMMIGQLAYNTPVHFVPPTVWRAHYGINGKRTEAKQKAISLCKTQLQLAVNNDDEADAILLGKYFYNFLQKSVDK